MPEPHLIILSFYYWGEHIELAMTRTGYSRLENTTMTQTRMFEVRTPPWMARCRDGFKETSRGTMHRAPTGLKIAHFHSSAVPHGDMGV